MRRTSFLPRTALSVSLVAAVAGWWQVPQASAAAEVCDGVYSQTEVCIKTFDNGLYAGKVEVSITTCPGYSQSEDYDYHVTISSNRRSSFFEASPKSSVSEQYSQPDYMNCPVMRFTFSKDVWLADGESICGTGYRTRDHGASYEDLGIACLDIKK